MSKELLNAPLAGIEAETAIRRRRIRLGLIVALFLIISIVGGRQLYHWIKSTRAAQFAAQADRLAAEGKIDEAIKLYRAALQLEPLGYVELQGAARLASRLNRPEAADLWREVVRLNAATLEDRQAYARALLDNGKAKEAEPGLAILLKERPDTETLKLAARCAQGTGEIDKAIGFARLALKAAPIDDSVIFELAQLLAASTRESDHAQARALLWQLSDKENAYHGQAVRALAGAQELTSDERERVLAMLENNPKPDVISGLMAADLRLQLHPDEKESIFEETIKRWNGVDQKNLLELARWLNLHGQPERVLALFPIESALTKSELLLTRLDALASLQRWDEIEGVLNRRDLGLDTVALESFRARTAQEKNALLDADVHWNHALSLASTDPVKLRFVANFATQSHAEGVALKAYEQLARIPEQAAAAYLGTEKLSARTADTKAGRAAAQKVADLFPDDPNAGAQLIYLDLLLGNNVAANLSRAKTLVGKYPAKLACRVAAALGYLRLHDPGPALAQFQGPPGAPPIEWGNTPAPWRAVYAASLLANEKTLEAEEIVKNISRDQLRPEEAQLIETRK